MTQTEKAILETLVQLEDAVAQIRSGQSKPDLAAIFQRLDALTAELPKTTPPDLLHYLHKKSYEKARLWLEGRDAENLTGQCRH